MKTKPASPAQLGAEQSSTEAPGTLVPAHRPNLRLERILVATDFSDCSLRALDYGVALAEAFNGRLVLLHVVEPTAQLSAALPPAPEEGTQGLLQAARERLDALSRKRLGHRVHAETLVRMGHAHSEIPDTARALGADLIILGARGGTSPKHVLLGGTAERVVRHAPCPVLTVPPPT